MRRYEHFFEGRFKLVYDYASDWQTECANCGVWTKCFTAEIYVEHGDGSEHYIGYVQLCRDYAACERRRKEQAGG